MKILFLGGDNRYLNIIEYLSENNDVDLVGYSSIDVNNININEVDLSSYDIIFFPISGINDNLEIKSNDGILKLDNKQLEMIRDNCLVFTGLITEKMKNIKKIYSFLLDEEFKKFNTKITSLGIIDDIKNINKKKICILGYGNIGRKVYEMLDKSKYYVVVGENDIEKIKKPYIFDTTGEVVMKTVLSNSDIIINTVPKNIINEEIITKISNKTYILDIASYPYGIDPLLVEKYNLNYKLFLGIPGKYKTDESGKILLKKVKGVLGGKK